MWCIFSAYAHEYSTLQVFWCKESSWYSWLLFMLCLKAKYRSTHPDARPFDGILSSLAKQPNQKSHTPKIPMCSAGKFRTKFAPSLHVSTKMHYPLFELLTKQAALQSSPRSFSLPERETTSQWDHSHNHCTRNLPLENTRVIGEPQNIQIGVIPCLKNRWKRSKVPWAYSHER